MRMVSALRYAASAAVLCGVAAIALPLLAPPAQSQANFVTNGEAGFVVSFIEYGLAPEDAARSGACPDGMTLGGNRLREAIAAGQAQAPAEGTGEAFSVNMANMFDGAGAQNRQGQNGQAAPPPPPQNEAQIREMFTRLMNTPNPCSNPENYQPDPYFRSIESSNIRVAGIDLDGQASTATGRAAPGTCAHNDFRGLAGNARNVDNQFARAVGCSPSFQPGNMSTTWNIEMLTGAWGIVFRLRGVDDIRNDNSVEVDIAANADPIQLSPTREPIVGSTYAMWQDPRFRATTRGRIVNGVLTTDPVDVRFWKITNSVWMERPLSDARLRVTISPEGMIEGYLAGYTPVEDMFTLQYGFRGGRTGPTGGPSPAAVLSALGASVTVGHSCNGAYYALLAAADGDPDPNTGRCTSISTQYHIRAVPAFVVDAPTESSNQDLERSRDQTGY